MKKIFILPSFERSVKKLDPKEKEQVAQPCELQALDIRSFKGIKQG